VPLRTILAIAVLLLVAAVPAEARRWNDNPLAYQNEPPPPTDADLERRERARRSNQDADDFTQHFGLDHGRAEILRYQLDGEPDSEVRAWVDGGGARVEVRW
jgi:hypothetical protein